MKTRLAAWTALTRLGRGLCMKQWGLTRDRVRENEVDGQCQCQCQYEVYMYSAVITKRTWVHYMVTVTETLL